MLGLLLKVMIRKETTLKQRMNCKKVLQQQLQSTISEGCDGRDQKHSFNLLYFYHRFCFLLLFDDNSNFNDFVMSDGIHLVAFSLIN